MPRYRHDIYIRGDGLPGHLARTHCGRIVAYGRQPNVPRGDARFCARCYALDEPTVSRAHLGTAASTPVIHRRMPRFEEGEFWNV